MWNYAISADEKHDYNAAKQKWDKGEKEEGELEEREATKAKTQPTQFATAGSMLLRTFADISHLDRCSERTWATQLFGLLSLGGHSLRSIRLDGYLALCCHCAVL
jgi:predicted transposase YdaD